jgi:5'-nucleotidase
MPRRRAALLLSVALAVGSLGACSSDGSDGSRPTATDGAASDRADAPALDVLVVNDDGYAAAGIDALVQALRDVDGLRVTVVAPLENQSGTGGKVTDGDVAVSDVKTASGYPAKAVAGFPADAVRVALEDLGATPDVVVSGINAGQNLGPVVNASGTVGAARAAAAEGIPALAVSQGAGEGGRFDFAAATPLVLDWLDQHRARIAAGTEPAGVTNLNVPTCATGKVRGLLETDTDLKGDGAASLGLQDCASKVPASQIDGDIEAFLDGFAPIAPVSTVPGGD